MDRFVINLMFEGADRPVGMTIGPEVHRVDRGFVGPTGGGRSN